MRADSTNPIAPTEKVEPQERATAPVYVPPAVLWEQEFVALATVSQPICDPPGSDQCIP